MEIIAIVERPEFADVATVIQDNLKNIGVPVSIQSKESVAAEAEVLAGNYDMLLSQRNRLIDIGDPVAFLTADYTCKGAYNLSHFCNQEYDEVIAEAARTSNTEERYKLFAKAGEILDSQAVNAWQVNQQATDAVRSNILSYVQDPLSRYVLTARTAKSGSQPLRSSFGCYQGDRIAPARPAGTSNPVGPAGMINCPKVDEPVALVHGPTDRDCALLHRSASR